MGIRRIQLFALVLCALTTGSARAAYDIPQHVIAGGGGTSAGGSYSLTGTIGQSVVGQSSGGSYVVNSGFWGGGAISGALLDMLVNLTLAGSGLGSVSSVPAGIACPGTCSFQFNDVTSVSLSGTPANGSSVFVGWLGPCTGSGNCVLASAGTKNVTATFAPNDAYAFRLDVDKNNAYDALTDGLLILRYLFGNTGNGLILGVVGPGAAITTSAPMLTRLTDLRPVIDVDGDGQADKFTDGILIVRYLFGMRGSALVANAVSPNATRSAAQIEAYIASLLP